MCPIFSRMSARPSIKFNLCFGGLSNALTMRLQPQLAQGGASQNDIELYEIAKGVPGRALPFLRLVRFGIVLTRFSIRLYKLFQSLPLLLHGETLLAVHLANGRFVRRAGRRLLCLQNGAAVFQTATNA